MNSDFYLKVFKNLQSHNSKVSPVYQNINLCYSLFRNNAVVGTRQKNKSNKNSSAKKTGKETFFFEYMASQRIILNN